ncbi:MAG: hypothetical protein ABEI52_09255, partial [Halobacteriaceae archaeon]
QEFLRYTGGDKKGLGIVLTPKHITELFAEVADVHKDDVEEWREFFEGFGIDTSVNERPQADGIHIVLYPQEEMETDQVEAASVIPLHETVEWAKSYRANFQPALEMLSEMYDLGLGVEYRERNVMQG